MSPYFVRYAQHKRGFEELYEVVERASNAAVSGPMSYDEAARQAANATFRATTGVDWAGDVGNPAP